jgi:purine catabolism regulator
MIEGIPLREVLALPTLSDARVIAGRDGTDRRVRSVNVMEVPDIVEWVTADELLLTTAYPLRDDRAALAELVPRLVARGLAGMAIKPTRYIRDIPQSMIDDAERLAFPLIELPPSASFNEIISGVLGVILDSQSMRLRRAADIHDRFTQIVLSGGGLRQISDALADAIGRPVVIVDPSGIVLARSARFTTTFAGLDVAALTPPREAAEGARPRSETILADGRTATVQPIQVGAELHGLIVAVGGEAEFDEDDLEAIEYAATVAALRQVQAKGVADADRRFQAVCLEELVTGHVTDRAVLMERSAAFGWDLGVPRAVLVAEYHELGGQPFSRLTGAPEEVVARRRLAEAARLSLGHGAIIWERSAGIAALIPAAERASDLIRHGAQEMQADAARRVPGAVIDIGVGRRATDPLLLARSFTEARRAQAVGTWSRGHGAVCLFDELDLDVLLFSAPSQERTAFVEAAIGALIEYDGRHRTNLVQTLDAYLSTRNVATAARRLFVHYNTLANRLARIEEVLGPFHEDPDRCLALGLAVRLRRAPGG